ncbi:hypothetical protein ATK86_0070 [Nocardia fluminea]|uniref:Uncharacterized protein n=2 Tax=Nocardia fluminea TaxID=134984 RepID=A0A2N3WW22_9NOCA|nr:hypothetical protein ATK86_0070 [Nocardia fluminea]
MGSAGSDRLMKSIIAKLAEALAVEGFTQCEALDRHGEAQPGKRYPRWRHAWFAADIDGLLGVRQAVMASLTLDRDGCIGLFGWAYVMSGVVGQVRAELPFDALESAADGSVPAPVDSVTFGTFRYPQNVSRAKIWVAVEADIDSGVVEFMDYVRGDVRGWFGQMSTITDLLARAREPRLSALDRSNPNPERLRAVVILALLAGRVQDVVSLMDWYRGRDQFHDWDSAERVAAFDAAISVRFPEYATARLA